ncbi:zinc-binding dehydrogenase [Nocardia tengchongensis]|uniref:zinc-binding dehydrogenase n=1 Tax=Nocardia tengchongensis TaxID=2055889 RepID=UPI0036B1D270
MQAFTRTDGRDPLVVFTDREVPNPEPNQALVGVAAYSVNRSEIYALQKPVPDIPGEDIAGQVIVGAVDGTGPRPGQRIVAHLPSGGWARYAAVNTADLAVLPDYIAYSVAAALPLDGITAIRLLRIAGRLISRRVLITGGSGRAANYFIELAAGAGAEVTVVSATPEQGRRFIELGADMVIADASSAAGTFDLVLDSAGGTSVPAVLAHLAPNGTLIWLRNASHEPVPLDLFTRPDNAKIRYFDRTDLTPPFGPDLTTLVALVATGRLHPEIGRLKDWAATPSILAELRDRRIVGSAVLTLSQGLKHALALDLTPGSGPGRSAHLG